MIQDAANDMLRPTMKSSLDTRRAFKWVLLVALYFSQGLPFGFFTQSLPVLMREQGYSLGEIGLASMLALPWALKFMWAPILERLYIPSIGRRRTWLLPLQALTAIVLAVLALTTPAMGPLLIAVALLNLLAATQDIATDGLAIDLLGLAERGLGNGVQVAGYRIGMIVGGGALLVLFERLGPVSAYGAMAALIALASVPVWMLREDGARTAIEKEADVPEQEVHAPHFFLTKNAARMLAVVVLFKAGDALGTAMLRPYLTDSGLSIGDIGWLLGTLGFISGLLGALAGGAWINGLGRRRALLFFGALQAAGLILYAAHAWFSLSDEFLYAACALEHFFGGMATAALFTCMMDWSRPGRAASDYTVMASAVVIATGITSTLSGFAAEWIGYAAHFAGSALLCALGVTTVAFLVRQLPMGARHA